MGLVRGAVLLESGADGHGRIRARMLAMGDMLSGRQGCWGSWSDECASRCSPRPSVISCLTHGEREKLSEVGSLRVWSCLMSFSKSC